MKRMKLRMLIFVNYCYHIQGCFKIGNTKCNMSGTIVTVTITQNDTKT